jgi:hypothetical protein
MTRSMANASRRLDFETTIEKFHSPIKELALVSCI